MRAETYNSLAATVLEPASGLTRYLVMAFLVAAGSAVTAIAAQIRIDLPFTPVPITGQTFAVLLVGATLGSRLGAAALIAYWTEGMVGFPVFAGGASGWAYFSGPTGGYILGFIAAAYVTGWLCERGLDRHPLTTAFAMAVGNVTIYVFGVSWLAHFVPDSVALTAGLYPFVAGDAAKLLLAAGIVPAGWSGLRLLSAYSGSFPRADDRPISSYYRLPVPWLSLVASVLVVVGAVLPWGLAGGGIEIGVEMHGGLVVLGAGAAGLVLALGSILRPLPADLVRIAQFAVGSVAGFAAFYHIVGILDASGRFSLGDLGAGLLVSALAAAALASLSLLAQEGAPEDAGAAR